MPTQTYDLIATHTVPSSVASVEFTGLTQLYRDLVISVSGTFASNRGLQLEFNGDNNSANYYKVMTYSPSGGGALGAAFNNTNIGEGGANQFLNVIDLLDYSSSILYKTSFGVGGPPDNFLQFTTISWSNTSPITSLKFVADATTFSAGATISIYGIVG